MRIARSFAARIAVLALVAASTHACSEPTGPGESELPELSEVLLEPPSRVCRRSRCSVPA
jgi:hypothetical protein